MEDPKTKATTGSEEL